MITAQHIRDLLSAQPFEPFRLFLSDGSSHDVPHPEFAWVYSGKVFIGLPPDTMGENGGGVKQLSLLHVSRIEPLTKPKVKKSRS
jgi:hypothetical protein